MSVQAEVLDVLRSLHAELGFGCLFVSHDLGVVNELTERVIVMRAGRIVEQGRTADVLRAPRERYTQELLASVPSPDPVAQRERLRAARAVDSAWRFDMTLPRIAIVGIAIESSAYAAHKADYRDFPVLTGDALFERYAFLAEGAPLREAAEWLPIFMARAIPGGAVRREVYDDFKQRIVAGLREAGPVDGVYFDIHGAMSVVDVDDAEGDLVTAVREVVGDDALIAAPMDLHGNMSETLALALDLPTCYRLAPHEDAWETKERSAARLVEWLGRGDKPMTAWVRVPILLPGEKTSTRVEPARSLYAQIDDVEKTPGVSDLGLWIGYAWADGAALPRHSDGHGRRDRRHHGRGRADRRRAVGRSRWLRVRRTSRHARRGRGVGPGARG